MGHYLGRVLAGAVIAGVAANGASAKTITTTIRDFCADAIAGSCTQNPDFEGTIGGLQTGQVSSILGGDKKPEWVGPAKSGFTTEANFDQWYNDVAGINMATTYDLTLTETAPGSGVYEFSDTTFYPIDGALFGNQGRSHNYHFTMELHGKMSFKDGDSFSFTGDDDLWVFIDDKLVMDLGGVHAALTSSFTSATLEGLGLIAGEEYDFDLFFAERHTTESNFKMTTSFDITPVPVPAALPIIAAALGGFGFAGWRRQRQAV